MSSVKQSISNRLKRVQLSQEEATYYTKFMNETKSTNIKHYEDIFTQEFDATGIDEKNKATKVKIKARKIESLNELQKISKIIQKKTLERPMYHLAGGLFRLRVLGLQVFQVITGIGYTLGMKWILRY
jgi:archaellum biogenesis protein FlaJ (TadC family)